MPSQRPEAQQADGLLPGYFPPKLVHVGRYASPNGILRRFREWGHLIRFDPAEVREWIDEYRRHPGRPA